jgi:hypothetical protein
MDRALVDTLGVVLLVVAVAILLNIAYLNATTPGTSIGLNL